MDVAGPHRQHQRMAPKTLVTRRRVLQTASAVSLGLTTTLHAQPPPALVIWFTVEGAKGMRAVGELFTAQTGVKLVVETPDPGDGPSKFQQSAAAGKGPDMFIYAHDRVGEWAAAGVLHAVNPGRVVMQDVDPLGWQGFNLRGRLWGYPYALEAVTLIYNKALVPTPPRDFDEVFALDAQLAKAGKRAILWDYTNTYFSWPLLAAQGGFAFRRRDDGSFDARQTGINNAGAKVGAELLNRLLRQGLMPLGSGYSEMEAAVAQGRVAMMINGPWAWVNLKRVGIDFGVARIPAVAGKAAAPFVGVKGIVINRATKQRELAVEFIENHLLTPTGLRLIDQAESIGAPASRAYFNALSADPVVGPRIAGIMASARDGAPTPSNPEMGRFWSAMKSALTNLSEGRQSPAQALDAAAQRVLQG
jgi:maltose/maltodextrin transport system substrate-binding protein